MVQKNFHCVLLYQECYPDTAGTCCIASGRLAPPLQGYAFVEFSSPEVAGIVAQTMNGYFLFDKQLVCRVLRFEEIHPNLFDGAGVKFRKVNWHGLYRQKYNVDR